MRSPPPSLSLGTEFRDLLDESGHGQLAEVVAGGSAALANSVGEAARCGRSVDAQESEQAQAQGMGERMERGFCSDLVHALAVHACPMMQSCFANHLCIITASCQEAVACPLHHPLRL
jgi:hypothetical protein